MRRLVTSSHSDIIPLGNEISHALIQLSVSRHVVRTSRDLSKSTQNWDVHYLCEPKRADLGKIHRSFPLTICGQALFPGRNMKLYGLQRFAFLVIQSPSQSDSNSRSPRCVCNVAIGHDLELESVLVSAKSHAR